MDLQISPTGVLEGTVKAPPSKSYSHRAIIVSSLSHGTVRINDPLLSADPLSTIAAMRQAGATIDVRGHYLQITGNGGKLIAPEIVNVGNSGTTLRILASVFSLCDKKVTLTGDESIQARPMGPLLEALEAAGVKTTSKNGNPPISVKGPISAKEISIRGDLSSQYISGLLLAAPLRNSDTTIHITSPLKSRPYLDLTIDIMGDFGVEVDNDSYKSFNIEGCQIYSKNEYTVEGDYSGAAFILGASALTEDVVTVRNLFESSNQGDKYFIDILKMMGAKVNTSKDSVTVSGGRKLRAVDIDLCDSPDLLPITAVLCSLANGTSTIHNVEHARIKECDRISAMALGLRKMGANVEERKDGLVIQGCNNLSGAQIESFKDHRIVMAFSVAAMLANGKTRINDAESVNISYPDFVEDMNKLGADMKLL